MSKKLPLLIMILPIAFFMVFLVALPCIYVVIISFMEKGIYGGIEYIFTLENYKLIFEPLYLKIFANSFFIALVTTIICLLISYPFACFISQKNKTVQTILITLVILPFLTNSLIRIHGLIILLRDGGIINNFLLNINLIDEPIKFMYNQTGTIIGMVYTLLPFMILPLYSNISKLDANLNDAAKDLGANKFKTFLHVTLPQTKYAILAGSIMVFVPTLSYFFVSDLLGGGKTMMIGNVIKNQFLVARNWPFGAALAISIVLFTLIVVIVYRKMGGKMEQLGGVSYEK